LLFTEEFHSTPETQTDESYNHPEDFEHFAQHESIERKEAEREAKFQGITVEEALASHEEHAGEGSSPGPGVVPVPQYGSQEPLKPKITRSTPPEKQDPRIKYQDATKEKDTQSEWGTGEGGYKSPKSPVEKLRYVSYSICSHSTDGGLYGLQEESALQGKCQLLPVLCWIRRLITLNMCSISSGVVGATSESCLTCFHLVGYPPRSPLKVALR
jgi:hypothetical protein